MTLHCSFICLVVAAVVGCSDREASQNTKRPISAIQQSAATEGCPFDEVIWRKGEAGAKSALWLVLTAESDGIQTANQLVARHAVAALQAAKPYDNHDCNFVFFIRHTTKSHFGKYTGFSREQLQAIASGNVDIANQHAWALGQLPRQE